MVDTPRQLTKAGRSSVESNVITEVDNWWKQFQHGRWVYEREIFRNILYYLGYQWVHFDANYRQWRRQDMKSWVPKPVTNKFAPTLDIIRSAIINAEPRFLIEPVGDDDQTIASARISNDFVSLLQGDSLFRRAKRELASWLVLTGTCGFGTEFSSAPEHGVASVPGEQCANCLLKLPPSKLPDDDVCPECGGKAWIEAIDASEDVARGRLITTAWAPFEMFVDQATPNMEEQPCGIFARSYHVETARRYWADSIDPIEPETSAPLATTYLNTVAVPVAGYSAGARSERVLVRRFLYPPSEKYPDGLYGAVTGGGRLLEAGPYPYLFKPSNRAYFPITRAVYSQVPGRFWGKTPANDLAHKQAQRNRMESLFELITMTMASPVWIIPTGSNPSKITGTPGIQITATPVSGMLPQRLQGMGPDASLVQFIEKIDQDFEDIANTFAVLKGKSPGQGIRSASSLRLLEERGYGAFGSVFENLEEMYENWARVALEQFRANAEFPMVRSAMTAYGRWATTQFAKSDLLPEISLRVEANSVRPKSSASRMDTIQRLVAMGAVSPMYPEQRLRILEESGMLSLIPGVDADKEYAMRENAQFMAWAKEMVAALMEAGSEPQILEAAQQPPPVAVNLLVDEHITHFIHHRRLALTDEYRELPDQLRAWWEQAHMMGHLQAYQQVQMMGGLPGAISPIPFGSMPPAAAAAPAKEPAAEKGARGGM